MEDMVLFLVLVLATALGVMFYFVGTIHYMMEHEDATFYCFISALLLIIALSLHMSLFKIRNSELVRKGVAEWTIDPKTGNSKFIVKDIEQ